MPWKDPEKNRAARAAYKARNRKKFREYGRVYRAKHPARLKEIQENYRVARYENTMLARCKSRAKKLGLAFDLTVEDIRIPERCPCLGVMFVRNNGRSPCNPSVDRIDPSKGYVRGNVWVISRRANTIKNNASLDELYAVVAAVAAKIGAREGAGYEK